MSLYMLYDKEYMADEFGAPIAVAMLLIFLLGTIISVGEISRIRKNKKFVLLPMLGMFFVACVIGLLVEFIMEVIGGDQRAIGPAYLFAVLLIVIVLSAYGIHNKMSDKPKKPIYITKNDNHWAFTRFSAEWAYDEVAEDMRELLLEQMSEEERDKIRDVEVFFDEYLEKNPEANDKIYIYACNYFAYIFQWLLEKGALYEAHLTVHGNERAQEDLKKLLFHKGNPAEYIYNYLDGKVFAHDIWPIYQAFMNGYYEGYIWLQFDNKQLVRDISYQKDYDEIVLENLQGGVPHCFCIDFDYKKYSIFAERLNKRFEDFRRNALDIIDDLEPYEETTAGGVFYSHALSKNMEVNVQTALILDGEKEDFEAYIEKCLAEIDTLSEIIKEEICKTFNAWGEEWIPKTEKLTPESFIKRNSQGEIQIFRPYGEELAYNLCFEVDFEEEHGVFVTIRGGHVIESGYRMDAESPWTDYMCKKYAECLDSNS